MTRQLSTVPKSFRALLVFLGVIAMLPMTAAAQTYVEGGVFGTWDLDGSPYRAEAEIRVPQGETLTIEAGVEVLFDADVRLHVQGSLHVHGTEADSVLFLPGDTQWWRGLHIEGGDSSSFAYARISDATKPFSPHNIGGGVRIFGSDTRVTMNNCVISGNTAEAGGGLANGRATTTLTDCIITGNTGTIYGGGMLNDADGVLTLINCVISGNTASGDGAGIRNFGATAALINCVVTGNVSPGPGGGIQNTSNATLTLDGCEIIDNQAGRGAGLSNSYSEATLINSSITGNTAQDFGGGINNGQEATITMTGTDISGNTAPYGGGLYNWAVSSATLTDCTITGNTAADSSGGGFMNFDRGTLTFEDCTISENSAVRGGGGISFSSGSTVTMTNCTISGNSATGDGGGLANTRQSTMNLIESAVSENSAPDGIGGGIENTGEESPYFGEATLNLTDCTVTENTAKLGGGIINSDGVATLTNTNIWGNTASEHGGGLVNREDATLTMTDCSVSGNDASTYGGGLYNLAAATLTHNTISGNTAHTGAGVYNAGTAELTYCTIRENAASQSAGGVSNDGTVTLADCLISENTANARAGLANWGVATLTNTAITGNAANANIGGLQNAGTGTMELTNCTISGNTAWEGAGLTNGGTATLKYCAIYENTAETQGGGLTNHGETSALTLINCTVSRNEAEEGGGLYHNDGTTSLTNSIFWANTATTGPEIFRVSDDVIVRYSSVQGGIPEGVTDGVGNISDDPLFVDPESGDFNLSEGSPCIDAGDPESPPDPDMTRADMGAFYFHQTLDPPVFITTELPHATERIEYIAHVVASNLGQSPLTFSLIEAPDWLSVGPNVNDSTGVLTGTPAREDVTEETTVRVLVENVQELSDEAEFTIAVHDTNFAPSFITTELPDGIKGHPYHTWIIATDPDGDVLSLSVFGDYDWLGDWTISMQTDSSALFMGTPPEEGDFDLVFVIADPGGLTDTLMTTLHVDIDVSIAQALPDAFTVGSPYPNPFNPAVTIPYGLSEAGHVHAAVYDLNGRLVRTLVNGTVSAGWHEAVWDAHDNTGRAVASGVYVYRVRTGEETAIRRMTLAR